MKNVLLFIAILISSPVFADNCDKPRDDFDGLYCLNKVYQESDKELNTAYVELRSFLTNQEKNRLKTTQVSWIKRRNRACSVHKNGQFFVSLQCTTSMTVARTNQLQDRIRECKAIGCQKSKL
ncbi:lysozyme inhibitor LprI family protein [Microbulbifer sp. SAOS-129_SWC]|uniref:lysozyme inhibitor LprI family protein n=1 Tax=Microbulbifer sp. SAOS-129_SWC TaxID=3145235 RepID=UPI003217CE2E